MGHLSEAPRQPDRRKRALGIVAGRRARLEPVTQVATRNESNAAADFFDRLSDTGSET